MTTRIARWFGIAPQMLVGMLIFSPVMAQDAPPRLQIHTNQYQVKPDMVPLFEDSIKSRRDTEKKHGMGFYFIFESEVGDKHHYMTLQTGDGSFNVPLPPEWRQTIQKSYDKRALHSWEVYGEVAVHETPEPVAKLMVLQYRTVSTSDSSDYGALLDKLIPALKKRDPNSDIRFARVALGDNTNKFVIMRFVDEWPTASNVKLDDKIQRLFDEGDKMVVDSQDYLYAYRKDLSFVQNAEFFKAFAPAAE